MYELSWPKDTSLMCMRAHAFPDNIMGAYNRLNQLLGADHGRTFFGISHPGPDGKILYWAAVEEVHAGEAQEKNCETYTLKRGTYLAEKIDDWRKNESQISTTFRKLLDTPRLDRKGACVEWYNTPGDVLCMVKLEDE